MGGVLSLLAGVCGMLLLFQSVDGITFSGWLLFLYAALLCGIIRYAYFYRRKFFYPGMGAVLFFLGISAFWFRDILGKQAGYIADGIAGEALAEPGEVTAMLFMAVTLLSLFLFVLEFVFHGYVILYLFVSGLLLLTPALGIRVKMDAVWLLAVFLFAFRIFHTAGRGRGERLQPKEGQKVRLATGKGIVSGILAAVLFMAALLLVFRNARIFYDCIYGVEGYASRTFGVLSGRAAKPVTGGALSRRNNYLTGTPHLELEISEQPTEDLYLRGFSGGAYNGSGWDSANGGELFENMAGKLNWNQWAFMVEGMYESMYYVMNSNMQDTLPEARTLFITHVNGKYENRYDPYYFQRGRGQGNAADNAGGEGYAFRYYERKDINPVWDNIMPDYEMLGNWYGQVQESYREEALAVYTQVPEDRLQKLADLVEEHPFTDPDEITAFILYTLNSRASYSLTPGWTPYREDIVEYFLFESGEGYCEHFASAATLMYRMYGIPARYVTGYRVQPSDFVMQQDGICKAVITDEAAHAWVEIFLENYGWVPIEVTPVRGDAGVVYPGSDLAEYGGFPTAEDGEETVTEPFGSFPETSDGETEKKDAPQGGTSVRKEEGRYPLAIAVFGGYFLCLFPFFLDCRRLGKLKKLEKSGCRKVFTRFMQMLRFGGYLTGYDGTEEAFAEKLAGQLPGLGRGGIEKMQEIVTEAAFGPAAPTPEKEAYVWEIYIHTSEIVYRTLRWDKKLIFRYKKAFW